MEGNENGTALHSFATVRHDCFCVGINTTTCTISELNEGKMGSDQPQIQFGRSRGIVWVCDLASSTKYLNDNQSANDLETYLPRLYWVALGVVAAAGGQFVKWTGDGFLAWFPVPLDRNKGRVAKVVYHAAYHLSLISDVSQLGVKSSMKFNLKHAVTYEQDALTLHITRDSQPPAFDLIGRAVVLGFRLSRIRMGFPSIASQDELVEASNEPNLNFCRVTFTKTDRLKYLKGESWGATKISVTDPAKRKRLDREQVKKQGRMALDKSEGKVPSDADTLAIANAFMSYLSTGDAWAKNSLDEYTRHLRSVVEKLKRLLPLVEALPPQPPGTSSGPEPTKNPNPV